ncbi:MAG: hexitol phosphatase HxpB [Bacteroidota bacterium]
MIEQVIYDMDGLMIDSEPFWQQAQIACFAEVGIQLAVEDCLKTKGIRIDEIVLMRAEQAPTPYDQKRLTSKIVDYLIQLIEAQGTAMPGLFESIELWRQLDRPIHLASSSSFRIIDAVLQKLDLRGVFQVVHSAEQETHGKPHPAVYLSTAQRIGVVPQKCLALEDSLNGAIAAKAAQMKLIVVPEEKADHRFGFADIQLNSLLELNVERLKSADFV